jgi:hypothetical protein
VLGNFEVLLFLSIHVPFGWPPTSCHVRHMRDSPLQRLRVASDPEFTLNIVVIEFCFDFVASCIGYWMEDQRVSSFEEGPYFMGYPEGFWMIKN